MADTLAELGVTRVSLGGSRFAMRSCGCWSAIIGAADIERAVRLIRERGMQVALDLIFATPGETLDQWQRRIGCGDLAWNPIMCRRTD